MFITLNHHPTNSQPLYPNTELPTLINNSMQKQQLEEPYLEENYNAGYQQVSFIGEDFEGQNMEIENYEGSRHLVQQEPFCELPKSEEKEEEQYSLGESAFKIRESSAIQKKALAEFEECFKELEREERELIREIKENCPLFHYKLEFDSSEQEQEHHSPPYRPYEQYRHSSRFDSPQQKRQLVKVLDEMRRMRIALNEYIHQKEKKVKVGKGFQCKLCDQSFPTGRQLGGHMSRKHPGSSESYNKKKLIHKTKKPERDRRKYFKRLMKGEVPKDDREDSQNEEQGYESYFLRGLLGQHKKQEQSIANELEYPIYEGIDQAQKLPKILTQDIYLED